MHIKVSFKGEKWEGQNMLKHVRSESSFRENILLLLLENDFSAKHTSDCRDRDCLYSLFPGT